MIHFGGEYWSAHHGSNLCTLIWFGIPIVRFLRLLHLFVYTVRRRSRLLGQRILFPVPVKSSLTEEDINGNSEKKRRKMHIPPLLAMNNCRRLFSWIMCFEQEQLRKKWYINRNRFRFTTGFSLKKVQLLTPYTLCIKD